MSAWTVFEHVAIGAVPFLLVAILALLWSWTLRRQVSARTRDLQDSLDRFRAVFEVANVGKSITLPTGELNINQAFADMLGYTPEELHGKTWQELTPPEDVPETVRRIAPMLDGREDTARFEQRYVRKDGGTVWADVSTTLLRDALRRPLHFITTIVDITQRKETEQRIEHLNRVLRAIRDVNQLITHETDRTVLLRQSCEILVATRGYRSAWVALRTTEGRLAVEAEAGIGEDFNAVRECLQRGEWPECYRQALASADGIVAMHDTSVNCKTCTLIKKYRDTAALAGRLQYAGHEYGVLVVALPEGLADDAEEQSLFSELIGDVSYALQVMDTERARVHNERTLQAIVQSTSDGILVAEAGSGRFIFSNQAICRMLGYPAQEMQGLSIADIQPAGAPACMRALFDRQARDEGSLAEDIPIKRRDGTIFPADVNSAVFELDNHRHVAGIFRDITTRKAAEEALRTSEERLQRTLDQMMEGCLILSFDWRYVYINDTAVRHSRVARTDLIGRTLFECYPGIADTEFYGILSGCMQDRKTARVVLEFQYPDGLREWFEFNIQPTPEGLFMLTLDIGDRKRHEQQLIELNQSLEQKVEKRTALLQAKNQELEAFVYTVAHDLRAPLRGIDGFSRILQEEYADVLGQEGGRLLKVVRAGAGKLDRLILDLLEYARIGKSEPLLTQVDMKALVQNAIGSCADPATLGSFQIRIGDLPSAVADPGMMERVWTNLLSNAVKYSIPASVHSIEVEGRTVDNWIEYTVRDQGVGFDPRYSSKLFGMFQRLHSEESFPGTGIGLAIVRKLVESHGGRIWAEGRKDEGAVFGFALPVWRSR
jgi:PAS domain S-box-containing protein